jgi:hypothetical protein
MYNYTFSLNSALDEGGWRTPRPGPFTPGNDPVPTVQKSGWAPGPVRTGTENLVATEIRSPDCPARTVKVNDVNPKVCRIPKVVKYLTLTSVNNTAGL